MDSLKYNDEDDRAYGLGGMAMAMVIWDNDQYLMALNLDADPDEGLEFTPDFFMFRNPKSSPRAAWNDSVERFQLSTGLLVSNVLCRALVREKHDIAPQLRQTLVRCLHDEGSGAADLTAQEVDTIFSKAYNYFHQIFSHPTVATLAGKLVESMKKDRQLDRDAVMEILSPLRR